MKKVQMLRLIYLNYLKFMINNHINNYKKEGENYDEYISK